MGESWDCVVVGGGFAGLACARSAAARGLSVLVLESKPDVGARPHTTGLLWPAVRDAWSVPPRRTCALRVVRLYSPSLDSIDLDSMGVAFFATDLPGLLRWLADDARTAGAKVRTGVCWNGDHPRCRFLVGADGPRSRVAELSRLGRNREFLVGVEAEYEGVRGLEEGVLHCFLDSELAPGYVGWVVSGCGITHVGLAARRPHAVSLESFERRISVLFDLGGAHVIERRGGLFPIGGPVTPWAGEGVLLVGDAAGFTSPLTGGGIARALKCGDLAGNAIADHLIAGSPHPAERLAAGIPQVPWRSLLRWVLDLGPPNRLMDAAIHQSWFRFLARSLLFASTRRRRET